MTGLDSNVLVQLALKDHPANAATVGVVQSEAKDGNILVFPPLVAAEFLHIVTDSKRFEPPLTMNEALEWLDGFTANPGVRVVEVTPESLKLANRWMREFQLGRKRVLDTQLAAIFHTATVKRFITSNPADFAVFKVFELVTP
jgi:predicted nucleic acid-binding protein